MANTYHERFIKTMCTTLKNAHVADVDDMSLETLREAYSSYKSKQIRAFLKKNGRKNRGPHSLETRRKIAAGNTGQIFTKERCKAISDARILAPSPEQLAKLRELWSLRHLNPKMIKKLSGIKTDAVLRRYTAEYCDIPQTQFMPSDMPPDELQQLLKLAGDHIHYHTIADILGRGRKSIHGCLTRMGVQVTTKDGFDSALEKDIFDTLRLEGFKLRTQYKFGSYFYDFHVEGTNLLIEVNGDYWHCNPVKYINGPINELQRFAITRDDLKRKLAIQNGYQLHVVWENDWKYDRTEVVKRLKSEKESCRLGSE